MWHTHTLTHLLHCIQIVLKPEHIQLATGSYAKSHLAPLGFLQKYTQTSANQGVTADGTSDGNGLTLASTVLPCIDPYELLTALLEKEERNKTGQSKRKGGHNSDLSKRVKTDNSNNSQQDSTTTPALNDYVPLGPSGHNSEGDEGKDENEVLLFRDAKVVKEKAGKHEKVIVMTDKKRKVNEISEKVIKAIKNKR